MKNATLHRRNLIVIETLRKIGGVLRIFDVVLAPIMDVIRRLTLAQAFFLSGLIKISNWDNALYLSAHEYPVSWLDPTSAAIIGVAIELICPVFLVLGLMTRLAALPMLILTIVAQTVYQPVNPQAFWIIIFGFWVTSGAGKQSLDHLLRGLQDSALPLAKTFSGLFSFLTQHVAPLYIFFMRLWIAAVLYVVGHTLMESMGLPSYLQFLEYQPQFSLLRAEDTNFWVTFICSIGAACIAFGFATRLITVLSLIILSVVSYQVDITAVQQAEFICWVMLLTILTFSGPGKYSLDHLIRLNIGKLFPQFGSSLKTDITNLPHVVIVGAGFGGVETAKTLRTTACRITLIDKHNYHLFQPLLYQVATANLSPSDIATPIRSLFRDQNNIRIMLGEVEGVDKTARQIAMKDGNVITYDYLVLATGARHSYFGKDEWADFAPGMKRVEDAIAVRAKLLRAFEAAENSDDAAMQQQLLTFIIVGGGPTGVELAGALAELAHKGMEGEFSRIDPRKAKIYLVEAGPRLLGMMPEDISTYTKTALEELGVSVLINGRVEAIDADGVIVNGERIYSLNVIWAAGVQSSPAAQWLNAEADRAGRVKVSKDLSVPGCEHIYAVGDTVLAEVWKGKPMPGLAPAAKQSGMFVAKHIRADIEGSVPEKEFHYKHYGSLATIGRKAAVADFGTFRMKGALAWWFWGAIHVMFLANLQNRISVMIEWFWAYVTFKRSTRLITETQSTHH